MTEPSSKSKLHTAINGACLVLSITGLALISNRLLDKAGVADAAPLSVSERAERAVRNQAGYDQGAVSATKAGWFSSDKFDCENQQVVDVVKNQLLCENLLPCDAFGFRNFTEVSAATPKQLDQRRDEFVRSAAANLHQLQQTSPNSFNWLMKQINHIADDRRMLFGIFPRFLADVSVVADDFNPQIGKYACHMTYRYDSEVFVPFWDATLRSRLMQDPTTAAGVDAELTKGQNSTGFDLALKLGMQKFRAYEGAQEGRTETLRFTVQPSQQSKFVVQITEAHLPGGRLIDN